MGKKSKTKGYRGEYLLVKLLNESGIPAQRVPLSGSVAPDHGDVLIDGFGAGQVKNREDAPKRVWDWLGTCDVLFLKRNRYRWLAVVSVEQLIELLRR